MLGKMALARSPSAFLDALRCENATESRDTIAWVDLRAAHSFARGSVPSAESFPAQGLSAAELGMAIAARWPSQLVIAFDQGGECACSSVEEAHFHYLDGGLDALWEWQALQYAQARKIVILGGKTGAGKTEWLHLLASAGQQVIDLEGIARHKGSVFGNLQGEKQAGDIDFQIGLLQAWRSLQAEQVVWIEEEGPLLGQVAIPKTLYQQMLAAPMIELEVPFVARLRHLLEEYGDAPTAAFSEAILKLAPRMGFTQNQRILHQYQAGKKNAVFRQLLNYYDAAYAHRRDRFRLGASIPFSPLPEVNDAIRSLIQLSHELQS